MHNFFYLKDFTLIRNLLSAVRVIFHIASALSH